MMFLGGALDICGSEEKRCVFRRGCPEAVTLKMSSNAGRITRHATTIQATSRGSRAHRTRRLRRAERELYENDDATLVRLSSSIHIWTCYTKASPLFARPGGLDETSWSRIRFSIPCDKEGLIQFSVSSSPTSIAWRQVLAQCSRRRTMCCGRAGLDVCRNATICVSGSLQGYASNVMRSGSTSYIKACSDVCCRR
ncbi:hypothetical protein MPTK1_6g01290 [Marchantia polymorpha subsp. ruderalis]|uniref:Uncharacterized protein n=2 Tax=Marchantia polymorpha TaxID=3197 RepID=A0AAF6BMC2_MARPO|nr:hypothetical protein MARPO_0052s0075 [Marchantia polymorpha]BBN13156.1 hypothetical protein Mp_6g01290 [Marchantia polymorpha subsp. ruderalis]|eukprot:PTQ38291.1 hypothetical protein MARPO_0052s0075 [Marchantia polymorpha]